MKDGTAGALRYVRGAAAGLAGIGAWLVVQRLDVAVTGNDYDDVKLLGMAFSRGPAWKPIGLFWHAANGALFGVAYAAVAEPRLPGPGWLRGLLTSTIECTTLSALTPLLDRFHPAIRDGRMAPTATPIALLQAAFRHAVFGAVLGVAYELGGFGERRRAAARRDPALRGGTGAL